MEDAAAPPKEETLGVDSSAVDSTQGETGGEAQKNVLTMGDVPPHPEVPQLIDQYLNAPWRRPNPEEEHNAFYEHFQAFMSGRGTPVSRLPQLGHKELDLHRLYCEVINAGGLHSVIAKKYWKKISEILELPKTCTNAGFTLRFNYMKYLYAYELHYFYGLEDDKRDWTPSRAPLTKRNVDPEKKKNRKNPTKKRKREDGAGGDGSDEDSDSAGSDRSGGGGDFPGDGDDSDDEYGRPKGQRKKKRDRSPKRWYPKKERNRKPPELLPDGTPAPRKDKKKKKQEIYVYEEEPDFSTTKVPPGFNVIPVGRRDLSRTPLAPSSARLTERGGEGLDMQRVLAQLFTNSRAEILAALNTLQRRSYDPDFDVTLYPHVLDHLLVVARNVWIDLSGQAQNQTKFSKNGVTPMGQAGAQELASSTHYSLFNLPELKDGPLQVTLKILNILRNISFAPVNHAVLANHLPTLDLLTSCITSEAVVPRVKALVRVESTPAQNASRIALAQAALEKQHAPLEVLLSCKPDVSSAADKDEIFSVALETMANLIHSVRFSTLPLPSNDGSDFQVADHESQITEAGLMIKKIIPKVLYALGSNTALPGSDANQQFALEAITMIATNPHSRVLFAALTDELGREFVALLKAACDKMAEMVAVEPENEIWASSGLQSIMHNALNPEVVIHMCQNFPRSFQYLVSALQKNTNKMIRELALGANLLEQNEASRARDLAASIAIAMTRMASVVAAHNDMALYENDLIALSGNCPRGTLAERLEDLVLALLSSHPEDM